MAIVVAVMSRLHQRAWQLNLRRISAYCVKIRWIASNKLILITTIINCIFPYITE